MSFGCSLVANYPKSHCSSILTNSIVKEFDNTCDRNNKKYGKYELKPVVFKEVRKMKDIEKYARH
jgi:hypothetical protein